MSAKINEDLVQDALIIIYEKYKTINFEKGIIPYAYRVLDYVISNNNQTNNRRAQILEENKEILDEIFRTEPSVASMLDNMGKAEELKWALSKLGEKSKKIILLKLQGFSGEEIMKFLGISEATLYTRTHRAVKQLKTLINTLRK